jgi:hypothetical protein
MIRISSSIPGTRPALANPSAGFGEASEPAA